jgi:hypothetical protein
MKAPADGLRAAIPKAAQADTTPGDVSESIRNENAVSSSLPPRDSRFTLVTLPLAVSIEVPKNWRLIGPDLNTTIEAGGEAATKLAGIEMPRGQKVNLFRANANLPATYAGIAINASDSEMSPADVMAASDAEIAELGPPIREMLEQVFAKQNLRVIRFDGVRREIVDGHPSLVIEYVRSGPGGPVVVQMTRLLIKEKEISLNLSYSQSEAGLWKPIVDYMRGAFRVSEPPALIVYRSPCDGFSVAFPNAPTFREVDVMDVHTHNYQAYSRDESVSYNVHFTEFEKKILSPGSQAAFLKNNLAGRLAMLTNPEILRDAPTTYNGLPGRDFAYLEAGTEPPVLFTGRIFLLDGDAVSLSMLHARNVVPQYSFEEFFASFRLLPLPANLSSQFWEDTPTGLRLRVPMDMKLAKEHNSSTGLIATFANASGHSLCIFDVGSTHPGWRMTEVETQLASVEKDGDGWYKNRIVNPPSGPSMVQLMKFFDSPGGLYMIQGYAPEQTFFRSEVKIKESAKTLVLPPG